MQTKKESLATPCFLAIRIPKWSSIWSSTVKFLSSWPIFVAALYGRWCHLQFQGLKIVPKNARAKPQKAQPSELHSSEMGTSWSLARGKSSVEVSLIHGGWVCLWLASCEACSEGSEKRKKNMLELISDIQTLASRIFSSLIDMAALKQIVHVLYRWYLARVTHTISKNDRLWYLGHGFAGPVHGVDVLNGETICLHVGHPFSAVVTFYPHFNTSSKRSHKVATETKFWHDMNHESSCARS